MRIPSRIVGLPFAAALLLSLSMRANSQALPPNKNTLDAQQKLAAASKEITALKEALANVQARVDQIQNAKRRVNEVSILAG